MKNKKFLILLMIAIGVILLALGITVCLLSNKDNNNDNSNVNEEDIVTDESESDEETLKDYDYNYAYATAVSLYGGDDREVTLTDNGDNYTIVVKDKNGNTLNTFEMDKETGIISEVSSVEVTVDSDGNVTTKTN